MRRGTAVAGLLLAILPLVYVAPALLSGRVLLPLDILDGFGAWKADADERRPAANGALSDVVLQFLPWDVEVRRQLAQGKIPWQDPWSGEATPLLANPQTALFSPFTWPRLVFGLEGWALSVFLRFWVAGLGMFWLARELRAEAPPAMVSGVVYQGSAYAVIWSMYPLANVTATLPLLAAAIARLSKGVTPGRVSAVVLTAALATAGGHPESLATGVLAIAAWLGWNRSDFGWRRLGWAAASALCGFLLLAVVTVPFAVAASRSWVAAWRAERPAHGLRVSAAAAQVLPGFLGGPRGDEVDVMSLWQAAEPFAFRCSTFIGAGSLLALAAAAGQLPRQFRRGLVIGAIALVASWCPPGLEAVFSRLPLLEHTLPTYRATGFVLFAALAAGPALWAVSARRRPRLGLTFLILGGAAALLGVAPSLPPGRSASVALVRSGLAELDRRGVLPNPPEVYQARLPLYLEVAATTARRRLALPGIALSLFGLGLWLGSRRLVICGAVGELLAFGLGYLPAQPSRAAPRKPAAVRVVERADPDHAYLLVAGPGVFPPNLGTLFQVRDLRSFSILEDEERVRWMLGLGYGRETAMSFSAPSLRRGECAALAAAGVGFFLSRTPVPCGRWIGGGAPPAVGVYALAKARPAPRSANLAPPGTAAGAAVSAVAGLAAILLVWASRRLQPPGGGGSGGTVVRGMPAKVSSRSLASPGRAK